MAKEWNVHTVSAYYVCNHKKIKKNTYYKSLKGKHLLWLDEYEMCSKEDIEIYLEWCKTNPTKHSKSVICLTTGLIFESQIKASKHYNISKPCDIGMCCKNIRKTRGKLSDGSARVLLEPLKPVIIISEENGKRIDSSRQVVISFRILAAGNVPFSGITITPSSALPEEIQSEIKDQVSTWRFAPASSDGQAKFEYSIIKR